jgi:hypothetical protein
MNRFGKLPVPYDPPGAVLPVPAYWERLWTDPAFQADLRCRWQELRKGPLRSENVTSRIDGLVKQLSLAQPRDGSLWNNPSAAAYPGEVAYLKDWLGQRVAWMDTNLPGVCRS